MNITTIPKVKNLYNVFYQSRNAATHQSHSYTRFPLSDIHYPPLSTPINTLLFPGFCRFAGCLNHVGHLPTVMSWCGKAHFVCPNRLFRMPIRAFPQPGKAFSMHQKVTFQAAFHTTHWYSAHCIYLSKLAYTAPLLIPFAYKRFSATLRWYNSHTACTFSYHPAIWNNPVWNTVFGKTYSWCSLIEEPNHKKITVHADMQYMDCYCIRFMLLTDKTAVTSHRTRL